MVVPGDVPSEHNQYQTNQCKFDYTSVALYKKKILQKFIATIFKCIQIHFLLFKTSDCRQNYEGNEVNLQLDGIESRHVHLHEPILPVNSGDPAVMDAS